MPGELVDWIASDDVAAIVKFDPEKIDSLEPLLEELYEALSDVVPEGVDPLESADPVRLLEARVGEGSFGGLDESRPSFLMMSSDVSEQLEACLVSSLPCPREVYARGLFGRMVLATDDPSELEENLQSALGEHIAISNHGDYLRVEFFYNASESDEQARAVIERRASASEPSSEARLTPALIEFLSDRGAYGVFARLSNALKFLALMEVEEANLSLETMAPERHLRGALAATSYASLARVLDEPESAEFEDVAIWLGRSDSGGEVNRAVATRTKIGSEIGRAGLTEQTAPTFEGIEPLIWGSQVADLGGMRREALRMSDSSRIQTKTRLVASDTSVWTILSAFQHLTAVTTSLFEVQGGPVAARWKAGRAPEHADAPEHEVPSDALYRNANVAVFRDTDEARADVERRRRQLANAVDEALYELLERDDGKLEVRTSHLQNGDAWFSSNYESLSGAFFKLRMIADGSEFITGALKQTANQWRVCCLPSLNDLRWSVGIDVESTPELVSASLYLGPQPIPETPEASAFGVEPIQPKRACLEELHALVAPHRQRYDEALDEYEAHLDSIADEYLERVDTCASKETATADRAQRVEAQFYWVRGQLAKEVASEERSETWFERACETHESFCSTS
ncbi:MAG: hypothetical protein ACOCV2_02795 [Persicimonas sp.]